MVRSSSIDLIVKSPCAASEKLRQLAEQLGGFLVTSESHGEQDASSGPLTIRVPAARFEEAQQEIRKLGVRVESEKVEAEDVTRQYGDDEARLRNQRAQETQYLGILKQAKTVKDTLQVSDKLNEVRGEIEQEQVEFAALSKLVETVAITVWLRAEAEAQVFGLHRCGDGIVRVLSAYRLVVADDDLDWRGGGLENSALGCTDIFRQAQRCSITADPQSTISQA